MAYLHTILHTHQHLKHLHITLRTHRRGSHGGAALWHKLMFFQKLFRFILRKSQDFVPLFMTISFFLVILCPVSFSYASIVFASAALSGLFLGFFKSCRAFPRAIASLSCSFLLQGLFLPARFIPSLLFFSTGIISTVRIHPQLALFLRRDYFNRSDSSPACSFSPQRLSLLLVFIPSLLFSSAGMISTARFHPQLALFLRRDDFLPRSSSLFEGMFTRG